MKPLYHVLTIELGTPGTICGCRAAAVSQTDEASVLDLDVVDVGELHGQPRGAAAAVTEVDLLQALGDHGLQPGVGGAGGVGVEQALGVGGGQANFPARSRTRTAAG